MVPLGGRSELVWVKSRFDLSCRAGDPDAQFGKQVYACGFLVRGCIPLTLHPAKPAVVNIGQTPHNLDVRLFEVGAGSVDDQAYAGASLPRGVKRNALAAPVLWTEALDRLACLV